MFIEKYHKLKHVFLYISSQLHNPYNEVPTKLTIKDCAEAGFGCSTMQYSEQDASRNKPPITFDPALHPNCPITGYYLFLTNMLVSTSKK